MRQTDIAIISSSSVQMMQVATRPAALCFSSSSTPWGPTLCCYWM